MSDCRENTQPQRAAVTGDVKVDLGGGATGTVGATTETLARILEIASEIWAAVCSSGVPVADDKKCNELMRHLQGEYKDFATSYPIPLRWMVQAREYESKAFEKFLREHVKVVYKDRKEFMAAQAEYLVIMRRIRHPRASSRQQLARYRAVIMKNLKEDDDQFTAAQEEAKKTVKCLDERVDADRRERICAYLLRQRSASRRGAVTTVAEKGGAGTCEIASS